MHVSQMRTILRPETLGACLKSPREPAVRESLCVSAELLGELLQLSAHPLWWVCSPLLRPLVHRTCLGSRSGLVPACPGSVGAGWPGPATPLCCAPAGDPVTEDLASLSQRRERLALAAALSLLWARGRDVFVPSLLPSLWRWPPASFTVWAGDRARIASHCAGQNPLLSGMSAWKWFHCNSALWKFFLCLAFKYLSPRQQLLGLLLLNILMDNSLWVA